MQKKYSVLAFYIFTPIDHPQGEVKRWKRFLQELDTSGRIYLNEEGINAQMSVATFQLPTFREWLMSDARYREVDVKVHAHHCHPFPKMTVKYRKQLVALGQNYDLSKRGAHLSSAEWAKMIEKREENTLILDVRNDYEWEVGHFVGAEKPKRLSFREFPKQAQELRKVRDPKKTRVMMYCTGGIRCEIYSALLKEEGFEEVYQLSGGIIKYGQEMGEKHWKGKLFVFDDRLTIPLAEEGKEEMISCCHSCNALSDTYYNCAHMDCNKLFISCSDCAEAMKGCCCAKCMEAKRCRPFVPSHDPKPFRKLSFDERVRYKE